MIIPAIIAKNQDEFDQRYKKVAFAKVIHLDLMDDVFVNNESLLFPIKLPQNEFHWHLMTTNPYKYIELSNSKIFYVHAETVNLKKHVLYCQEKSLPVCFAINPQTPITYLNEVINNIDRLLIMTVEPGQYGAQLVTKAIRKIKGVPPHIKVCVDGAMNNDTIKLAKYAEHVVSGSYLQKTGKVGYKLLTSLHAASQTLRKA